jgi:hypothetical protein
MNFGRVRPGWTQDMRCDAGVCAEDKHGGTATLCVDDERVCAATRTTCAVAQDGKKRCLPVADLSASESQECYKAGSYGAIALYSCPAAYSCNAGKKSATALDYSLGFCYSDTPAAQGQSCKVYGGGVRCNDGLHCTYYIADSGGFSSQEVCVSHAKDGERCGGASFSECIGDWPVTGKCDNGACKLDRSKAPPCAEGQEVIKVLDPRDTLREAEVCVNYQQEQGKFCQVSAPPLGGAIYQEFKCKEGLLCTQREGPGRFNVDGTCSVVVGIGARCSLDENIVCPAALACLNETCQPLPVVL